jgi:two-component system chemotaxis response regulator CheY
MLDRPPDCLIVDDSDVIRKIAAHFLAGLGCTTRDATNGEDAIAQCRERMPDLIVLDWHMPVMAGQEFITTLRALPGGGAPQVLYCTTENEPFDIARALTAGANDYLMKPFDKDGFCAKVEALLAA